MLDQQFEKTMLTFSTIYSKGQEIYAALEDNREEGMDILYCPAHIGDTLWICVFADAYKKVHGCSKLLFVVPQSQTELIKLFPSIDDTFGLSKDESQALEVYIGFNKFWCNSHIRFTHFEFHMYLDSFGINFTTHSTINNVRNHMNETRQKILELPSDSEKNYPIEPECDEEMKKEYANAVLLLPTAQTQVGEIEDSFWNKIVYELNERGYDVYCNYNNLPYEKLIEGTIPLSTGLTELYNLAPAFKRFIGFRSGILDLLTLAGGRITVVHPDTRGVEEMELTKESQIIDNLFQLRELEGLQAYQYKTQWENDLVEKIIERI